MFMKIIRNIVASKIKIERHIRNLLNMMMTDKMTATKANNEEI